MTGADRLLVWSLCLASACDLGEDYRAGERPTLVESSPSDGELQADRRLRIRLRFDELLAPTTVNRATVSLRSGAIQFLLSVSYDPIEREILAELFGDDVLDPGVRYVVEVDGAQSLEGEPVEPAYLTFRTGTTISDPLPQPDLRYADVQSVLSERCATSECHGATEPPLGLDLSSPQGIAQTAIGVSSQQGGGTDRLTGRGLRGFPIIDVVGDRGRPATSYLLYKILGVPHVGGNPMPPDEPLSAEEIRRISDWIGSGARVSDP